MGQMAASQDFFFSTCSSLLERMINTAPRGVTLTDIIEPIPVKPDNLDIDINRDGTMTVSGLVRVRLDRQPVITPHDRG